MNLCMGVVGYILATGTVASLAMLVGLILGDRLHGR